MEIVNNQGLIVRTKTPEKITNNIKASKLMPDGSVLVKWTIKTAQKMRMLGYKKTPSPISVQYDYPGFDRPMAHQYTTAEFMTLYRRCFCLNEMGTGKSRSVIWAADYLMKMGLIKRVLIVAPLSILKSAWESDIMVTAMHRSFGIAVGDAKRRQKVIESGCEFCIINHDGVKSSRLELARAKFDLIIIDEATAFSNTQTDRWKAMDSLVTDDTWLWQMTGTPAANSPLQAYGLAKLNDRDSVPKYFTGWKDKTMNKVSTFTFVPKEGATQMVFDVLQPAIRFEKKDCLDLPPLVYELRDIPMDKTQSEYYERMRKQMLMQAAGETITAVNSGVLMSKLLQIACGAVYSDDGRVVDFMASKRLNEMLDVINECSAKVLVFAQFKSAIKLIADFLEAKGIECAVIDGDVPPAVREMHVDMFQNSCIHKVLIMQPKTAAHGLTLTAASTTIWFGPVSSLEIWRQANARMDRPGQVNSMTIVKLCGSPVERRVYSILSSREASQQDLLNLYREEMKDI